MKLRMKLRQTGAVTPAGGRKALNVEHRTPNIERRILMTLRFIYFKIREPQNIEGWNRYALSFKSKFQNRITLNTACPA